LCSMYDSEEVTWCLGRIYSRLHGITFQRSVTFVVTIVTKWHLTSPAYFCETWQWLKCPLNGLRVQSRVSPVVGLLPLTTGLTCLGMAFPPFLTKQLYRCDSVIISSFVRTGYTTRR